MPRTNKQARALSSNLFIPILLLSLLTFGFSFDRFVVDPSIGVNSYLIIFIGLLLTIISLFLMKTLAVKYPDQSVIGLGNRLLGPFGKIGTTVWFLVIFALTALLVRRVTDEVSTIILFRTPGLVSMLAFLAIAWYITILGEEALGRLSSVLLFLVPLFLILLLLSFRQVNFLNIHPVNIYRDLGYLRKWDLWLIVFTPVWIMCSASGNESLRNSFKPVSLAITCGAIILGITSLAITGAFGAKGTGRYEWPVMSLMNITELAPSYFFQNFITMIYFFIFLAFSLVTVAGLLMVLSKGLTEFLGLKDNQAKFMLFLIIAALFGFLMILTQIHFKESVYFILKVGSLYTFGYMALIWVSSLVRRKE
jgi:spore germination protein